MTYDFSRSADRSGAHSEKWSRRNIEGICGNADALPFWVADMDLATTGDIRQALVREAERGVIGYRDDSALIPSFISFMKERHECTLSESEVSFAQGMLHAIALALNLFTKEGDGIALPFPSYHPFIDMVDANRRTLIPFHLKRTATGFELDTERWQKETEGAKAILFCSPHNPTGIVFDEGTLKTVLTLAKERGQIVLCDEIHADLSHPGHRHIPLCKANRDVEAKCITFAAASKSFNIAGEHCAFAIFSDGGLKERYEDAKRRLYLTSPGYSVAVMAEEAYSKGLEYNRALCDALARKLDRLESFINTECPGIRLCRPQASFIAFLDCSGIWDRVLSDRQAHPELYDGDHFILSHFFGQRGGICMNDGSWFGDDYASYVRFNFGCGDELLERGLEGLKRAVDFLSR